MQLSGICLRDYAERYAMTRLGLSDGYLAQIHTAIRAIEQWAGRPLRVQDLSDDLVLRFLSDYSKRVAASTVNGKRRMLLTIWTSAAQDGLTGPPGRIPRMKEPYRLPEAWFVAEIEQLVSYARTLGGRVGQIPQRYWWPSLILATYYTGARITSLRSLATADCHLGDRYIVLRAASDKGNRDRYKPLADQAVAAIAAHYDPQRKLIWPWPHCRRHFWRFFRRRIVEPSGLTASRGGMDLFHRLRRSSISYAAAVDPSFGPRQAGHSDPRVTQRHYIDPRIAMPHNIADALPALHLD